MIVTAFFIARYANQSWQVTALNNEEQSRVENLSQNVQQLLNRDIDIKRALRRVSTRSKWQLMALNTSNNELELGFPPALLRYRAKFKELKDLQAPVLVRTGNMEFVGPFIVNNRQQEYQLYIGRLMRLDQRPGFAFGIALLVFIVIGSLACIAIAYTITQPLKELSLLSKDIAKSKMALNQPLDKALSDDQNATSDIKTSQSTQQSLKKRKDEIGQLHSDMLDMADKLAKSLSQQKALMANISHELRTPLTRLSLSLAMLNVQSEEQKQYAQRIEKEIAVMDTLIGQSLQLVKIGDESQAHWMQRERINLQSELISVLEDLQFEAKANDVELSCADIPNMEIWVVKSSLVSALENVTRNAIKFSNGKALLGFKLVDFELDENEVQARQRISVNALPPVKQALEITVDDNGVGISKAQMADIFEPFYRANSLKHYQGTGLGLAIAKAAVELHYGRIDASASSFGGLRLSLYFPLIPKD